MRLQHRYVQIEWEIKWVQIPSEPFKNENLQARREKRKKKEKSEQSTERKNVYELSLWYVIHWRQNPSHWTVKS